MALAAAYGANNLLVRGHDDAFVGLVAVVANVFVDRHWSFPQKLCTLAVLMREDVSTAIGGELLAIRKPPRATMKQN